MDDTERNRFKTSKLRHLKRRRCLQTIKHGSVQMTNGRNQHQKAQQRPASHGTISIQFKSDAHKSSSRIKTSFKIQIN